MGNTWEYLDILNFVHNSKCVLKYVYTECAVFSAMTSMMSKKEAFFSHKKMYKLMREKSN